jgi:hypothetical protein
MTTQQYIFSLLAFGPNDTNSLLAQMIDQGIDPTAVYDVSMKIPCVKAAIGVMQLLLTTPDTDNRVDGTSGLKVTYDRKAVIDRINLLKGENGLLDDSKPYIRGPRVW